MATPAIDLLFPPEEAVVEHEAIQDVEDPVTFGWENQWQYQPDTRLFDLSRKSARTLTLASDENEATYNGIKVDPSRACLVVVDMQNYFINPDFHHHGPGLAAVAPILLVIERCRREGVQIVWLNWVTNAQELRTVPPAVLRCFNKMRVHERSHGWGVNLGSVLPNGERVLFEDTFNADLYPPLKEAVRADDVFCRKSRMSGMWSPNEDLHRYLTASGMTTVMFAGINTDQCVLSTLTDTHSWGWDVLLLRDCTGTMSSPAAQQVAETNIAVCMGFVMNSKALIEAKSEGAHGELVRHDSGFYSDDSAIGSEVDSGSEEEMAVI